ncbi:MAG: S8 family peptidase [Elusimicrobiaceae bacterium]|nr:S8 family peptidase [Elusimicrobiaceae bacterium]
MKRFIKLMIAALFFAGTAVQAQDGVRKIVFFRDGIRAANRAQVVKDIGGEITYDLHLINAAAVVIPADSALRLQTDIKTKKGGVVVGMEDDRVVNWISGVTLEELAGSADMGRLVTKTRKIAVDVPKAKEAFSGAPAKAGKAQIPWGIARVKADRVWTANTGAGVTVAVIDTGIDLDHPDLADNIAGSFNAIDSSISADDDQGHGTHVAGTIAGSLKSASATGVAPNARLYAVKVLGADGSGSYSTVANGIQWAVANRMQVINMSLGSSQNSEAIEKLVAAAYAAGVTVVCAAGNDGGSVGYPAANKGAIAIAASDNKDKIAYFSNRGDLIQFITPGVNIYSTYRGGGYKTMSGTSMASPHAAGLAALAVAAGAKTPDEVVAMLKAASVSLNLKPTEQGNGLIEADRLPLN